jgi:hypothetical protein
MSVVIIKAVALPRYKKAKGIDVIHIKRSKTSQKLYAVTEDGEYIGMVLPDMDKTKEVAVITFRDEESGEEWNCLGNRKEASPIIESL